MSAELLTVSPLPLPIRLPPRTGEIRWGGQDSNLQNTVCVGGFFHSVNGAYDFSLFAKENDLIVKEQRRASFRQRGV